MRRACTPGATRYTQRLARAIQASAYGRSRNGSLKDPGSSAVIPVLAASGSGNRLPIAVGAMGESEAWRYDPRVAIDGEAFWSAGRQEGSCRLIDLSAGGVGISEPNPALRIGTQFQVCLVIGTLSFESVPVEAVRISEAGIGLCFRKMSDELRERIDRLVHELTEAS